LTVLVIVIALSVCAVNRVSRQLRLDFFRVYACLFLARSHALYAANQKPCSVPIVTRQVLLGGCRRRHPYLLGEQRRAVIRKVPIGDGPVVTLHRPGQRPWSRNGRRNHLLGELHYQAQVDHEGIQGGWYADAHADCRPYHDPRRPHVCVLDFDQSA
jgi:hypothetical protein